MKIAMLGTRGVPARYGGFETCVEEVGSRLAERGHDVTVYCRTIPGTTTARLAEHLGMRLVHLPAVHAKVAETMSHTALSVAHLAAHRTDAALVFNAANAPLLPAIRAMRIPVATHVDGLEWKRAKWGGNAKRYYRRAEGLAVRWSDALIADATGIADYYQAEFGAPTELISYGAPVIVGAGSDRLAPVGLESGNYHLVVARFEPENNVDLIVRAYRDSGAARPLVVVGSAPYNDAYTAQLHASADSRVRFLGGIWDQDLLDQIYANAYTYLHGHSVGGTNPSLLRALGAGAPVLAYNVGFNVEVAGASGRYFSTAAQLSDLLVACEADEAATSERGLAATIRAADFSWDDVAAKYEELCERLPSLRRDYLAKPSARPNGKRRQDDAERDRRFGGTVPLTGFLCSDFDLFHVGDLQAVQDARGQCDRLIAGVLSDEMIVRITGRAPVISASDRVAIVENIRHVDDVVVVHHLDPQVWQREFGFDVLFDGPGTGLTLREEVLPHTARVITLDSHRVSGSTALRSLVDAGWDTGPYGTGVA